jgi:hypothetical protein
VVLWRSLRIGSTIVRLARIPDSRRMTHQAVTDHFDVSRITITRSMICLRQTGRTNDRPCNDRPRVTSQRQDRHLRLIHLRNRTGESFQPDPCPPLAHGHVDGALASTFL